MGNLPGIIPVIIVHSARGWCGVWGWGGGVWRWEAVGCGRRGGGGGMGVCVCGWGGMMRWVWVGWCGVCVWGGGGRVGECSRAHVCVGVLNIGSTLHFTESKKLSL